MSIKRSNTVLGVLCAVLERHVELLHRREGELLAIAR